MWKKLIQRKIYILVVRNYSNISHWEIYFIDLIVTISLGICYN